MVLLADRHCDLRSGRKEYETANDRRPSHNRHRKYSAAIRASKRNAGFAISIFLRRLRENPT